MYRRIFKKDIIERFAAEFDLTKKDATSQVDFIFETIIEELISGTTVSIKDLGKFEIKQRTARSGVNPATLEKIDIPARKTLSFKASAKLKEAVK
ncbi:MAG: HU family DNA-binding protein [Erysipelotrichaceae bacterium]|jgi:DNA-binding protein HU-beta